MKCRWQWCASSLNDDFSNDLANFEGKQQERKHITDTLIYNGYPRKFLQEIGKKQAMKQEKALSSEELVNQFFDLVEPPTNYSHAILPYIKGLTNLGTRAFAVRR